MNIVSGDNLDSYWKGHLVAAVPTAIRLDSEPNNTAHTFQLPYNLSVFISVLWVCLWVHEKYVRVANSVCVVREMSRAKNNGL